MLKYILICLAAVALSFLTAGVASHAPCGAFLRRLGVGADRAYRFYLGCSLLVTLTVGGSLALAAGYGWLSALVFGFVAVGGLMAISCVESVRAAITRFLKFDSSRGGGTYGEPDGGHISDGGGNCEGPIGDRDQTDGESHTVAVTYCAENGKDDQTANGDYLSVCETSGTVVVGTRATDDRKMGVMANTAGWFIQKPRTKAIICCVLFAVSLVVFAVFFAASSGYSLDIDDAEILEKNTVIQRAERMGDTLVLTAEGGAETFLLFGYGAILDDVDELTERLCDGEESKIRYAVVDEDKWSGEYMLIDARRGDEIYLRAESLLAAREQARVGKLVLLGACSAVCGVLCALYTVISLKKGRTDKRGEFQNSRISE